MPTSASSTNTKKNPSIQLHIHTTHTYLSDDSEFQSIISDVVDEYVEKKHDIGLKKSLSESKKMQNLDAIFLSKVGHT